MKKRILLLLSVVALMVAMVAMAVAPAFATPRVYVMNRASITPSGLRHTMKGSTVVAIGVGRRRVGRDNATCWQAEGSDFPNFAWKLSEKSRRHPKRGPTRHPNRPVRPVLTPIHAPNARPERHPNPFLDSFHAKFAELSFRDCLESPQVRASRLVMRRIMAALTNASPLAHSLS